MELNELGRQTELAKGKAGNLLQPMPGVTQGTVDSSWCSSEDALMSAYVILQKERGQKT